MVRDSCTWKISGTKTFRLASTKILKTYGGNLANIEKSQREIYIPDDGKMLGQRDQSGAEALKVAYLCEAGAFRQLFIHKIKPHVYVALHVFKDIWKKKMRDIVGDIPINFDEILSTPIQALKSSPYWKELDHLIKESDNWSMSERYYYLAKQTCHSCVDGKTMVLTRAGWKLISEVASVGLLTEEIAIYDKGEIRFEIPKVWNKMSITDTMYQFDGDEINQLVTGNHRVIYSSNKSLYEKQAKNAHLLGRLSIPTSGNYIGGQINLPDWQIKLLVAIQADGHWCMSEAAFSQEHLPKVIFRFKRKRKIDRILSILKESGYRFTNSLFSYGVTCITVFDMQDTLQHFKGVKQWGSWLLNLSKNNLELFVDELKYWDGTYEESFQHKREAYFTMNKYNASWVKTVCHLVGKQGTRNQTQDKMFVVGINNRKFSIVKKKKRIDSWTGDVYCPSVSSGMFLINRQGKISVTGNSNYGIEPPMFRMNILEKSGSKIVISKEDSEHFLMTYHAIFPEIKEWHRRLKRQVEQTKVLYNFFGEPYQITSYSVMESQWKELYAWIPQSSVGELTNRAFAEGQTFIEKNKLDWDLLINGHDSIVGQFPISELKDFERESAIWLEKEFESPVDGTKFRMRSEFQAGMNWAPFKKDKNPLGLKEIQP